MATITTINAGDNISDSRSDINTNFANLNSDKMETSVLDTDTALTANSDSKVPSQKAIKSYVDNVGGANASTSARGIAEEATAAEIGSGTAAGATGARLFMNPSTALLDYQAFTATDTWTKPSIANANSLVFVRLWGAGGGGGSAASSGSTSTAGGGGGGACVEALFKASDLPE